MMYRALLAPVCWLPLLVLAGCLQMGATPGSGGGGGSPGVSTANSTTETLTGSATYTGTWEPVAAYNSVRVRVVAAGAVDAWMDFSEDCSTVDSHVQIQNDKSGSFFHSLKPYGDCYRLVITDVSGSSNAIRAKSYLSYGEPIPATRIDGSLDRYSNAIAIREVSSFDGLVSAGKIAGLTNIHKFGRNDDVGTSAEPVTSGGFLNWQTTADEYRIKAGGNAADDAAGLGAQEITCVALLASTWVEDTFTLTTAGASASSVTASQYIRPVRCYVSATGAYHGTNTGDIVLQTEAGTDLLTIKAGIGQTQYGAFTCPGDKTCQMRSIQVCVDGAKGADVFFWQTINADDTSSPYSGAQRLVQQFPGVSGCHVFQHSSWEAYAGKVDLWATAITTSGSTSDVSVEFEMLEEAVEN